MTRPKGKLFALLAVFAAIGLVAASGAFTSVQADRTATVNVTGDSSALLGLSEPSSIDEGAVTFSNGQAEIDLTSSGIGADASGLNPNATTALTPLLNITNNGNNDVDLTVSITSVGGGSALDSGDITVVDGSNSTLSTETLSSGDTQQIGLVFNLRSDDVGVDDISDDFEIVIEIEASEP